MLRTCSPVKIAVSQQNQEKGFQKHQFRQGTFPVDCFISLLTHEINKRKLLSVPAPPVVVTLASMLRWIWPNLECNLKTRDSQVWPHKRWPAYSGQWGWRALWTQVVALKWGMVTTWISMNVLQWQLPFRFGWCPLNMLCAISVIRWDVMLTAWAESTDGE